MKVAKKIGLGLLLAFIILVSLFFSQIVYGLRQLKGQVSIIRGSVPINEYLQNPTRPDSIKQKLILVQEVKKFAFDSLGLKENNNYSTVYDQGGKDVLWVVTACQPYKLEPKLWDFLFLGEVSYKGYFVLNLAINEARDLQMEGWDVSVRPVTAWSTLGWFNDPILTNMLDRNTGEIAELFIHELTHGTLFVKDSVDFNENLASFIGEKGAELFLIYRYGKDSRELEEYLAGLHDENNFSNYMLLSASHLDSLYNAFDDQSDSLFKAESKVRMIDQIVSNLDTVNFIDSLHYQNIFQKRVPNNAYFMAFIRYKSKEGQFEVILQRDFDGDLKRFLKFFKSNYPTL